MQYYRLWIYSCNSVLGVTSAIFTVFAAFVLADVRLSLLGGIELYHPTFLYAYVALILQCGVVQAIGCLGAQRLNHKLLSVYWILLLLLTIGDVVVGLVWVYKLDKVKLSLKHTVLTEFKQKYSIDASFTSSWNKIQAQEHCCGVEEPADFNELLLVEPNLRPGNGNESNILFLPDSCCTFIYTSEEQINQLNLFGRDHLYNGDKSQSITNYFNNKSAVVEASFSDNSASSGSHSSNNNNNNRGRGGGGNLTSSSAFDPMPSFTSNNLGSTMSKQPIHKQRHAGLHHRKKLQSAGAGWSMGENQTSPGGGPGGGGTGRNNSSQYGTAQELSTPPPAPVMTKQIPMSCQSHELVQHSAAGRSRPEHGDDGGRQGTSENSKESNNARINLLDNYTLTAKTTSSNQSAMFSYSVVEGSLSEQSDFSKVSRNYRVYYNRGCRLQLTEWLDYVSGVMFILGFCIIGFIKACFLFILRREIREMIEKIQVLESEHASANAGRNNNPPSNGTRPEQRRGSSVKRDSCAGGTNNGGAGTTGAASSATATSSGIVTIKSPQGDGGGSNLTRHDRSTSHSQETVNMNILITTPKAPHGNGPKGPIPAAAGSSREQNRSSFHDDSADNEYFADAEAEEDNNVLIRIPSGSPASTSMITSHAVLTTTTTKANSSLHHSHYHRPSLPAITRDMSFSSSSSFLPLHPQHTNSSKRFLPRHNNTTSSENASEFCELLIASVDVEALVIDDEVLGGGEANNWKQGNKISCNEPGMAETYRRNGNNNIKTSNSFTLALLGTAV